MSSILRADSLNLEDYLSLGTEKNIFKIPYTQRPYEWNNIQVKRLFNDIVAIYENRGTEHVLNFITIYKDGGYQNIYDGQQRTVTLILIVSAIINKFKEISIDKEEENSLQKAEKLKANFIMNTGWRDTDSELIKLRFDNEDTNNFFINYVIKNNSNYDFDITDKEKRLKKNYDLIKELLDEYMDKTNMDSSDLSDFVEVMMDKMYVILLKTENEEIANQMFETLNNTGKKLSNFYVVKNKCVKILGEEKTAEYWDQIEVYLDNLNKNNFLSQYVSMFNGKTGSDGALTVLEEKYLIDENSTIKTLQDMLEISKYFLEVEQPGRITNPEDSKELKKYIEILKIINSFKAKQFRPLLFSLLYKNYNMIDINSVLKRILSLQIRNFFIAKNNPNTVENLYPKLAKIVYESNENETDKIIEIIKEHMASDNDIVSIMKTRYLNGRGDNKLIRIILKEIYDNESYREIEISNDSIQVNLEHILPQNPSKDSLWMEKYTDEEREKYTYMLGNMTLILGTRNSSLGNKDFQYKKEKLMESDIPQNKELAQIDEWTKEIIENRTEKLTRAMLKII